VTLRNVLRNVGVRLDDATIARVDALASRYAQPWRTPSRSDLLRIAILSGLDAEEKGAPRKPSRTASPPKRKRTAS
jgi:hypothetical protein